MGELPIRLKFIRPKSLYPRLMATISIDKPGLRLASLGNAPPELLDETRIFEGIAWAELEILSRHMSVHEADPEHVLFAEGESGSSMFILVRGKVETFKAGEQGHGVIAMDGAGKAIGEMALIDGEPRSATCVVREPSLLLTLTRENFDKLSRSYPAVSLHLIMRVAKLISRRLRATSGRLIDYLDD